MYSQRITRENPLFVGFMVDQSGSMQELITYQSREIPKSELVVLLLNRAITELVYRSRSFSGINDYFYLSVLGYGGEGVKSLLPTSQDIVKISTLDRMDYPTKELKRRVALVNGGSKFMTSQENIWVEASAEGDTPMGGALDYMTRLVKAQMRKFIDAFPAIVINISDGEPTDCSPEKLVEKSQNLKSVANNQGNVIFMNIHIGGTAHKSEVIFPSSASELPSAKHAELLYDISSELPDVFDAFIRDLVGESAQLPFKAMSYNASITSFFSMLNIGSITLSLYSKR